MTITRAGAASPGAATATTFVFTTATTLGHTPATGNLVVVMLRRLVEDAVTAPSGWTAIAGCSTDSATGTGQTDVWYRVIDGTESATYTWSFSSSSRGAVLWEWNDSVAGTWVLDQAVAYTGNASSNNAQTVGPTATLTAAAEVAMAWILVGATISSGQAVDSGFTNVVTSLPQGIEADKITAATTALNPSFSWGGSARQPLTGGVVTFYRTYTPITFSPGMLLAF